MPEKRRCIFNSPERIQQAITAGVFKDGKDPHPCRGKKTNHHIRAKREGGNGIVLVQDCCGRERTRFSGNGHNGHIDSRINFH